MFHYVWPETKELQTISEWNLNKQLLQAANVNALTVVTNKNH